LWSGIREKSISRGGFIKTEKTLKSKEKQAYQRSMVKIFSMTAFGNTWLEFLFNAQNMLFTSSRNNKSPRNYHFLRCNIITCLQSAYIHARSQHTSIYRSTMNSCTSFLIQNPHYFFAQGIYERNDHAGCALQGK
jgi:hypothetical protein